MWDFGLLNQRGVGNTASAIEEIVDSILDLFLDARHSVQKPNSELSLT